MWNYRYRYPDELYHHGVKGMRWGFRKAKNALGNALIGKYHNGPRKETGLRKIAANAGRKLLGRKRVYAQRHTYTHSRGGNAISIGHAAIQRVHTNRINVVGNDFRRISRNKNTRNVVNKLLSGITGYANNAVGSNQVSKSGIGRYKPDYTVGLRYIQEGGPLHRSRKGTRYRRLN